ncbi:GDP-L-fucose synthase [Candidatus Methylopumilus universalis]|uniref:GDP-L-fucose synthase n=1 Tax=Candidatus Methylopumilus universalis TaxID=2588536 RepID=UPI00111CB864|nr:GDP-L-fucose synthase [Candidatus Methylopumilus universalis]QDC47528.1 GDP-L-fucose synthase [Candidatus Methylopumilus universalis]QDC72061.1 GDP-L-fucose synthase [Candidatus Methylopumilus universalis]
MKNLNQKIYVAGHQGMVGSTIIRILEKEGYTNIICRTHKELDLIDQLAVNQFFEEEKPDQVYLAAAKVGGIFANNNYPAEFIYKNLLIEANVIHASYTFGVKKLLFLGSSCIYPKEAEQPMKENVLLSGYLEPTNEPYAIAKIAGIKLCESYNRQYGVDYRSVMPTNLYGPGDNYHSENSHVIPALIRRFHEAKLNGEKEISIWGSGAPKREFLYVDDMAAASIFIMDLDKPTYEKYTHPMQSHINVGCGEDISIKELAILIKNIIGYEGQIIFDISKPDGTGRKLMDSDLIASLGWKSHIALESGLKLTYQDFLANQTLLRAS